MASDMESRFGHLLQPIRDLAQNWHIDIAQELEEYLHELDSLTISIDTSQPSSLLSADSDAASPSSSLQSLNFAEAALLIQGSACVYSKKVEYLYSLLYQTLDAIIDSRRKQAKKTSSISQAGQDADVEDDDAEEELLPLDDLQEASNIDLDERNATPYAQLRKKSAAQH